MDQRGYRSDCRSKQGPSPAKLPYRRRGPLLTQGEAAFYRVLRLAIGRRVHVAFKARLADLITCSERAWEEGFGHMIARHHIDFVLCDYRTTEILVAIELDDRSHEKASRRRRDRFLNQALSAAGIPLVRIQAAAIYSPTAIASALDEVLRSAHGPEGVPAKRRLKPPQSRSRQR